MASASSSAVFNNDCNTGPPRTPPPSRRLYCRVDRRDISLLRFILEAYDGVATLTTIDPEEGIVLIRIAPGHETLVTELLDALCGSREVRMEMLSDPPPAVSGER